MQRKLLAITALLAGCNRSVDELEGADVLEAVEDAVEKVKKALD